MADDEDKIKMRTKAVKAHQRIERWEAVYLHGKGFLLSLSRDVSLRFHCLEEQMTDLNESKS